MTDQAGEHDRHIVVGIDRSPGSQAALRWALTQAELTGAAVEAVAAWQEPVVLNHGYPMGYLGEDDLAALTRKILDDVVEAVTAEPGEAANPAPSSSFPGSRPARPSAGHRRSAVLALDHRPSAGRLRPHPRRQTRNGALR